MRRRQASTLRPTLLKALLPAAVIYGVALSWSAAEGISSTKVLRDLAQDCGAPLGQGFLSSLSLIHI